MLGPSRSQGPVLCLLLLSFRALYWHHQPLLAVPALLASQGSKVCMSRGFGVSHSLSGQGAGVVWASAPALSLLSSHSSFLSLTGSQ